MTCPCRDPKCYQNRPLPVPRVVPWGALLVATAFSLALFVFLLTFASHAPLKQTEQRAVDPDAAALMWQNRAIACEYPKGFAKAVPEK